MSRCTIMIGPLFWNLEPEEMIEMLAAMRDKDRGNEYFESAQAKANLILKEAWVYLPDTY